MIYTFYYNIKLLFIRVTYLHTIVTNNTNTINIFLYFVYNLKYLSLNYFIIQTQTQTIQQIAKTTSLAKFY